MADASQKMTHRAYTVVKREGQEDYWLQIGAAFEHADGKGFNIVLQASPLDGRIVLRLPKDEDKGQEQHKPREQRDGRQGDRRRR